MNEDLVKVIRVFGNKKRLYILEVLSKNLNSNVSNIARELKISVKSASKHLVVLRNLEIVVYLNKYGHTIYSLNPHLPQEIHHIIRLLIK